MRPGRFRPGSAASSAGAARRPRGFNEARAFPPGVGRDLRSAGLNPGIVKLQ